MRKHCLVAVVCLISSIACAQEWKPALDKWRACADAAAVRYAKSTESAPVVARLAIEFLRSREESNFGCHQTG